MAFADSDGTVLHRGPDQPGLGIAGTARVLQFPISKRRSASRPDAGEPASESAPGSPFPEIDCVRDRLSLGIVADVERRAIDLRLGAEQVLVAADIVDEEAYLRALARHLWWDYDDLSRRDRAACPLNDTRLLHAARYGLLPFMTEGQVSVAVAPRCVPTLLNFARAHPRIQFQLTSAASLNNFIMRHAGEAWGNAAANALRQRRPDLSAAGRRDRPMPWTLIVIAALYIAAMATMPGPVLLASQAVLAAGFLIWLLFRLVGCFLAPKRRKVPHISDDKLPIYTVIVALYRESKSVAGLVAALRALDYPREKLEIKLVIEPDDVDTRDALDPNCGRPSRSSSRPTQNRAPSRRR